MLDKDDLLKIYRTMSLLRALDEKMLNLQRQGRIGFYGTCTGQEAAVVGSGYALEREDWVFPALREVGVAIMRGYPLERLISQLMGNCGDVTKGRQMPCHYSDRSVNYVSWSSCVGTQLPHAVGAAYAMRLLGQKRVTVAYLGDGATSEADFHVAMNFAGVLRVPVVFFCQNNQWAISVPFARQTASETIAVKAAAYGFEGVRIDGNDVFEVYETTKKAVEKARSGNGPTLIEALTYRMGAHSSSDDPRVYRDEREVEAWRERVPIVLMRQRLAEMKLWSEDFERELQGELEAAIEAALVAAEKLPPPEPDTMFDDVYSDMPWHLAEQRRELAALAIKDLKKFAS